MPPSHRITPAPFTRRLPRGLTICSTCGASWRIPVRANAHYSGTHACPTCRTTQPARLATDAQAYHHVDRRR